MPVKSKVKISKNFVAFSEYMNFTKINLTYFSYLIHIFFRKREKDWHRDESKLPPNRDPYENPRDGRFGFEEGKKYFPIHTYCSTMVTIMCPKLAKMVKNSNLH